MSTFAGDGLEDGAEMAPFSTLFWPRPKPGRPESEHQVVSTPLGTGLALISTLMGGIITLMVEKSRFLSLILDLGEGPDR